MSLLLPISRTFTDEDFLKDPTTFFRTINKFSQDVANSVNARTIGAYTTQAQVCGNKFFYITKPGANDVLRKVLVFTTLLSGNNTLPIGELLPTNVVISAVYGMAQSSTTAVPLPFVNVASITDSIGLSVNISSASVIVATSTSNWESFSGFVTVEYL